MTVVNWGPKTYGGDYAVTSTVGFTLEAGPEALLKSIQEAESQALDQGLVSLLALEGVSLTNLELVHWGNLGTDRGQWSALRVHGWACYVVHTAWQASGQGLEVKAGWVMYPPPAGPGYEEDRKAWNDALFQLP